jgi:hypothetical protein
MRHQKNKVLFIFSILLFSSVIIPGVIGCKDIVVTPRATGEECSLFLKVRDPSRDGLQVLCRVPYGTQYMYHYPWTGKPWMFTVVHTFIGVTSQGDTLPNITKPGMVFTNAGLVFGDADTGSRWINPTKNAWDDFDWMRYAYQTAENEDQAITLLTTDAVDQLHATGVSENLFVVGPTKAVVIEADAAHHVVKEIPDVLIMSNYPDDLWRTQCLITLPIASSLNTTKETWVRQGGVIHLGSVCGVKLVHINQSSIRMKAVPTFAFRPYGVDQEVTITLGERATVGPYSVTLLDINDTTARLSVCTSSYAWEQELLGYIQPMSEHITVEDMMNWSRLHAIDLNGLRAMCEDAYPDEAAMIYKIPQEYASLLSSGWFAANHACASIYVPIHICDNDFFVPYQTGEAAALSLELLHRFGHGVLMPLCQSVETIFRAENEENELIALEMIQNGMDITPFLTALDRGMQEQAFLTEQLWLNMTNTSRDIIQNIWMSNYSCSLQNMHNAITILKNTSGSEPTVSLLKQLSLSIGQSKRTLAAFHDRPDGSILDYFFEDRMR